MEIRHSDYGHPVYYYYAHIPEVRDTTMASPIHYYGKSLKEIIIRSIEVMYRAKKV